MRYQHKWNDIDPSEVPADGQANLEATIHRALELGINHIETARGCTRPSCRNCLATR